MTSVLLVEDEPELRRAIARGLRRLEFHVSAVGTVPDALDQVKAAQFDVLVTDLRVGLADGIDLILQSRELAPHMRSILISGYASARDFQTAMDVGTVRVLCKPFAVEELASAIRQAMVCGDTFHGSVFGVSLVDVLQMYHLSGRSVYVRVAGAPRGRVYMDRGEIVHAMYGDLEGRLALEGILRLPAGAFDTLALEDCLRTIDTPFEALLLELLSGIDLEARRQVCLSGRPTTKPDGVDASAIDLQPIAASCRELVAANDALHAVALVDLETGAVLGHHVDDVLRGFLRQPEFHMALSDLTCWPGMVPLNGGQTGMTTELEMGERRVFAKRFAERDLAVVTCVDGEADVDWSREQLEQTERTLRQFVS